MIVTAPAVRTVVSAGPAVVRNLRVLVHRLSDAVTHERPDDSVAALVRHGLDGMADVAQVVAGQGGRDAGFHAAPGELDEVGYFTADLADGPRAGTVGMPAVDDASDVDAHEITIHEPPAR